MNLYKVYFKEIKIKYRVKKNRVKNNYYFDYLINAKKLESKNILANEKNYIGLVIYFARYNREKSLRMLSLCYHKLVWKTGI